jgi:two-component system response regulator HydG
VARVESSVREIKNRARILVIDDEIDACAALSGLLESEGYDTVSTTSPGKTLELLALHDFDLVMTDVSMGAVDGLDLCRKVTESRPEIPTILISGRGDIRAVIRALHVGAQDFLMKPIEPEALMLAVRRALGERAHAGGARIPVSADSAVLPASPRIAGMMGRSPAIRAVHDLVADLSESVVSVLVQGETGTGKEIIARAIHDNSQLRKGPFVALNCATMSAELLENELFGHARGAFTDARTATKGLLLAAHGGTLLLDEIGELPLAMQPKLLRALQERAFRPVGSNEEVHFDCRLIVATNRDLEVEVAQKRFREDLYYRIHVVKITVPPLRERGDDILILARHFLEGFAKRARRTVALSAPVARRLLDYDWPGNVRELENCIERAVALSRSDLLTLEDLPNNIRSWNTPGLELASEEAPIVTLNDLERRHILATLKRTEGNKTRAADLLRIDRRTLHRRLKTYETVASSDDVERTARRH